MLFSLDTFYDCAILTLESSVMSKRGYFDLHSIMVEWRSALNAGFEIVGAMRIGM
jgi:hypothetical protein